MNVNSHFMAGHCPVTRKLFICLNSGIVLAFFLNVAIVLLLWRPKPQLTTDGRGAAMTPRRELARTRGGRKMMLNMQKVLVLSDAIHRNMS